MRLESAGVRTTEGRRVSAKATDVGSTSDRLPVISTIDTWTLRCRGGPPIPSPYSSTRLGAWMIAAVPDPATVWIRVMHGGGLRRRGLTKVRHPSSAGNQHLYPAQGGRGRCHLCGARSAPRSNADYGRGSSPTPRNTLTAGAIVRNASSLCSTPTVYTGRSCMRVSIEAASRERGVRL